MNLANELSNQTSPYLLQHKENPVAWKPWGDSAFQLARELDRPIFLSIGYSTCHWCHVMAHESFEDPSVAHVLNTSFIAIKVDREERPDIDSVYMTAVQAMVGQGGWPLSVWLTPTGEPFFGGTYFPKERFVHICEQIKQAWNQNRGLIIADAENLRRFLRENFVDKKPTKDVMSPADFATIRDVFVDLHRSRFDETWGGFGRAPKFPQTMNLMVLLRQGEHHLVEKTLDEMGRHGMYDHVHGGFHRYSTDAKWHVPHFEKMLYDQAWLAMSYLEGYLVFKKKEYARLVRQTLDYIKAEMTGPSGEFFSAQDADSLNPITGHNEEGFFATYNWRELTEILNETELQRLSEVYGVTPSGGYEGRNILDLQVCFDPDERDSDVVLVSALKKLRVFRATKPAPHLDDKVITAWNAWMISAFVRSSMVLKSESDLDVAVRAAQFIEIHLVRDGKLQRSYRAGVAQTAGLSDDYAAYVAANLDLYEATGDFKWLEKAQHWQSVQNEIFWDKVGGGYFREDRKDPNLIYNLKEDHDGVRPSANSLSCMNLLRLYHLTLIDEYRLQAYQILNIYLDTLKTNPLALPYMVLAGDFAFYPVAQIVITPASENYTQTVQALMEVGLMRRVFASTSDAGNGNFMISVCEWGTCHQPQTDLQGAKQVLRPFILANQFAPTIS